MESTLIKKNRIQATKQKILSHFALLKQPLTTAFSEMKCWNA
jgi:hypothetical protein